MVAKSEVSILAASIYALVLQGCDTPEEPISTTLETMSRRTINVDNNCDLPAMNWRYFRNGAHVEMSLSGVPYGASGISQDTCFEKCAAEPTCKQAVWKKSACYPMSEASPHDQDGKGGTNSGWVSINCNKALPLTLPPTRRLQSAMDKVLAIKPTADVNKKEGVLYDLTSKISEMCTVSEADIVSGSAATKNRICGSIGLVVGNYYGKDTQHSSSVFGDMKGTGCSRLPLAANRKFFLFGILLPKIEPLGFDGGNLCYAQLLNGNSPEAGTGLLIFAPKLFTANPIVKNLNVPVPGTGEALNAAASTIICVAVGVSLPSSGTPAIEVEFSNDFWKCTGECKTIKAHVFAAIKLDITEYVEDKLKIQLGDITVFFDAKCFVDFDPSLKGFGSQVDKNPLLKNLVDGVGAAPSLHSLINPKESLSFLRQLMQNDFSIGIDGKLGITLPLKDLTHGLFEDLDITISSASALFRKFVPCRTVRIPVWKSSGRRRWWGSVRIQYETRTLCEQDRETGLWASLVAGGFANKAIMDDIQQKVLNKFQTKAVKAVVGLLGKGIEAVVNAATSTGQSLQIYAKGNCEFQNIKALCSSHSMGMQFKATGFEAYIERTVDGKVAFCFAIKDIYDSCGGGLENILMLLKKLGELLIRVATTIADAVEKAFDTVGKEVAQLSVQALEQGKVVVDKVGAGFEKGASDVKAWSEQTGGAAIEFAGSAAHVVGSAASNAANTFGSAANTVGNGAVDFGNGAVAVGNGAVEGIRKVFR